MFSFWHRTAMRRMTRAAARPRLAVESLDDRITPAAITAVGAAVGSPPVITVYDAATQQQKFTITAFDPSFTGGVTVAVGDVNGDGTPDVVAGAGAGGGPVVNVYSGTDGSLLNTYTVGDADSRAGVTVAAADFNADGRADLVVGAVLGGAPVVQVLNGVDGSVLHQFTPFAGVSAPSVAAGDVNGDGTPDVVAGSGAGGAPRVVAYDGKTEAVLADFFAFEQTFVGGVSVATGDLNGDGAADIIAAAGVGGGPRIQTFDGDTKSVLLNFFAYDSTLRGGVTASAADTNGDGSLDVVARDGSGQNGVAAFDGRTGAALTAPSYSAPPVGATDTTAPTLTIASSATATTKVSPIPFTATFSEAVNGFTADDLTATNGTVGGFTQSGNTYTFTVTPTAAGAVTVSVAAGAATDAAGNANAAASITRTYSSSAPVVTATTLTTNDATPTLTGTVDDPAATVSVTAGGQTVTATVSGSAWSATLGTALAAGTYDISVTATDAAGRTGTTAQTGGLIVDLTAPTVSVTSTAPEPTKTSPIPFTVAFSEAVNGFTASDITATNGTVAAVTATDGKTYAVTVTPTGQGAVTVTVAAGVVADAAGNTNAASNTLTRTFDSTIPTVTLTAQTTNDPTPTLTGTVGAAAAATISVAVGGQTIAATISGATWSATVPTALADGTYSVTVTATDAAGNVGTTTSAAGLVIDQTTPTAVVTVASDPTNASPIPFTVTFSEPVTNLTTSVVTATGGTILTVSKVSATVYTVFVTPFADGAVTLTVPAGATSDLAGNATAVAASKTVTSDRTAPTAVVSTAESDPSTANPLTFTVTFNEAVTGLAAGGVTVTNGSVLAVTAVDATTYTVTVVPAAAGTVTVAVPAGAATDAAGNGNAAATPVSLTYSGTAIGADLTTTATALTNASTLPFSVTFTADVTGFSAASVVATNGSVGNFIAVDARTYTFDVTPAADGAVTVMIPAGAASNGSGTPASGDSVTVTSDRTAPTATVVPAASTGLNPITFTVTFNEDVTALTAAALTATNGTIGTVTAVDAKTYTVVVTPTAAGAVALTVPAGAVADPTGNATTAAFTGTATPASGTDSAGLSTTLPTFTGGGVTTLADGLKIKDVTVGTGAAVTAGQSVTVQYTLWLTDGTQVQTSVGTGGPLTFSLSNVIAGWKEGIVGMQPGGIRELYVPAALGYGSQAQSGIPANSDLVFAVKLISAS